MNPSNSETPQPLPYVKDDFITGQDVRWCPGCGNFSILATMQRTLAKFAIPRENYAFISGIGCSSRLPYYVNTYGFHTVHGRAPTIATGLKCVNPDLTIFVITGDGDGLSIGGNHLVHAMRRNLDLNILLVNNQIYGLTKGQCSPTSKLGQVTRSTPEGSADHPVNALCVAISSEATFVARTLDTDPRHMGYVLSRAIKHKGVSFVEIYQNCQIFNNKAFSPITSREHRDERMIYLEDGKPLTFGAHRDKAIRLKGLQPEIVHIEEAKSLKDLLVHRENDPEPNYAYFLTQMQYPEMPVPFGVFRDFVKPTYEDLVSKQVRDAQKKLGKGNLKDLLYGTDTWAVKPRS